MTCMMVGFESRVHTKGFMKWAFIKEVAHVMKQYSIVKWLECVEPYKKIIICSLHVRKIGYVLNRYASMYDSQISLCNKFIVTN